MIRRSIRTKKCTQKVTRADIEGLDSFQKMKAVVRAVERKEKEVAVTFDERCTHLSDQDNPYYVLACGALHYLDCRRNSKALSKVEPFSCLTEATATFKEITTKGDWKAYEEWVFRIVRSSGNSWMKDFLWTMELEEEEDKGLSLMVFNI